MTTATTPRRGLNYWKARLKNELSGLRFVPEGSPEREAVRKEIARIEQEIAALKSR